MNFDGVQKKENVREITAADYPLLEDFLYNAIYISAGEKIRFASYRDIPGVTEAEIEAIAALRASRDTQSPRPRTFTSRRFFVENI